MTLDHAKRDTLIQQYADGPARLRAALAKVPAPALTWRPAPKEWSAHEIVCHCADSETNAYARIRFVVAEKTPTLQGYDQDNWAAVFGYHQLPLEPALAVVEAVRASTAALIRGLACSRSAARDHLEGHARQIENNVAQWKSTQSR